MGLLDAFGGGAASRGGGMSPITLALAGLLAYRTFQGKGRLADMLGTNRAAAASGSNGSPSGNGAPGIGGSPGSLGGILSAGGLSAGLKDLLDRFRQAGHDKTAQSWVSTGSNQPISPPDLERVLGEERLQWLMEQTGLPKDQLLNGLSSTLPSAIDKLTPDGRVPTDEEIARDG